MALTSTSSSKPPAWVTAWFLITIPVIFWDAGYCFMRPRSFEGGDLHWIWKGYEIYQNIDLVYGVKAFENGNGFTNAQAFMNLIENTLNIVYLYLAHIAESPIAPLVGFASVHLTVGKTVLYWMQEYYCGFCAIGHNSLTEIALFWVVPNGLWIVVPSFIAYTLGKQLVRQLYVAHKASKSNKRK